MGVFFENQTPKFNYRFLGAQKELRAQILVGCSSWYLFWKFHIDFEKSHVDFVILVLWSGVGTQIWEISWNVSQNPVEITIDSMILVLISIVSMIRAVSKHSNKFKCIENASIQLCYWNYQLKNVCSAELTGLKWPCPLKVKGVLILRKPTSTP